MANIYEAMFLVDPVQAASNYNKVREHIANILNKHNVKVLKETKWTERSLAYTIKRQKRGTYILMYLEAPTDSIAKINAECELSETVLRVLMLKVKSVPKTIATSTGEAKETDARLTDGQATPEKARKTAPAEV
ncbi:MAG: 30S ribosomal protein S6 [Planctomycetes bacterium]|nr:30S ribosomal protein S6 [Planctomycetota bacterium]